MNIFKTIKQWALFLCILSPTWVWSILPACIVSPIALLWAGLSGMAQAGIIGVVSTTIIGGLAALFKKIKANHIRPWSFDGKNNTDDINIKSPGNGDPFIQVYGRVIKASFWATPISFIFNPFFRMVTKFYYMGFGDLSTPTPKPISRLRVDDFDCDFLHAHMKIRKAVTDRFFEVRSAELALPECQRNQDLLSAIGCISETLNLEQ